MNRTPPHIPLEPPHERPLARPMHHGRVVPRHQIPGTLPLDTKHVFLLRRVREKPLDELCALGLRDALEGLRGRGCEARRAGGAVLEVVQVVCDVEVLPAGWLVGLEDAVAAEGGGFGVDVTEVRAVGWSGFFARVHEVMGADVIVLGEVEQEGGREVGGGGAGVGEIGVAAVAGGWELVGAQERVACAAGVEGGVDVEDAIALKWGR